MSLPRASSEPTMGVCPFEDKVVVVGNYQATWEDGPNKFGYKSCLNHWIEKQEKNTKASCQFYGIESLFGLSTEQFNTEMFIFNSMSQGEKNRHLQGFALLM